MDTTHSKEAHPSTLGGAAGSEPLSAPPSDEEIVAGAYLDAQEAPTSQRPWAGLRGNADQAPLPETAPEPKQEPAPTQVGLSPPDAAGTTAEEAAFQPVKVFSTEGRIGRLRYFAYHSAVFIGVLLGGTLIAAAIPMIARSATDHAAADAGRIFFVLAAGVLLATLILFITLGIRRSRDMNLSGWWALLTFIPMVALVGLFVPGTKGANRFGPPPPPNNTGVEAFAAINVLFIFLSFLGGFFTPYRDNTKHAQQAGTSDNTAVYQSNPAQNNYNHNSVKQNTDNRNLANQSTSKTIQPWPIDYDKAMDSIKKWHTRKDALGTEQIGFFYEPAVASLPAIGVVHATEYNKPTTFLGLTHDLHIYFRVLNCDTNAFANLGTFDMLGKDVVGQMLSTEEAPPKLVVTSDPSILTTLKNDCRLWSKEVDESIKEAAKTFRAPAEIEK